MHVWKQGWKKQTAYKKVGTEYKHHALVETYEPLPNQSFDQPHQSL